MSSVTMKSDKDRGPEERWVLRRLHVTVLLLLILFSLYSAVEGEDASLILSAAVDGGLFHGFSSMDSTSSDMARLNISAGNVGDQVRSDLDLESSEAQAVGYYNLLTTGASQAQVSFSLIPLTAVFGDTTYYVPYLLSYEESNGTGNVKVDSESLGSSELDPTTTDPGTSEDAVLHTQASGLRWKTLELYVTFNGDANEVLPESSYSGYVVATVTAE